MTELSQELKDRVLTQLEAYRPRLVAMTIVSERKYVLYPVFIDGVIDWIRYNVAEQRFDQLEVTMAKSGIITSDMLAPMTAFCDDFEKVVIPLPATYASEVKGG